LSRNATLCLKPYCLIYWRSAFRVLGVSKDPLRWETGSPHTTRNFLVGRLRDTRQISCRDSIQSLQLCVLRLGLLEDGNVGVGVFQRVSHISE
jgi:hypothetical protein